MTTSGKLVRVSVLVVLGCFVFGTSAAEGPRAFFGFATHYETPSSGRGEALVRQVVLGSPAERAGLQPGDRVVAFNGVGFSFADEYQFMQGLGVFESGKKLTLTLLRHGKELDVDLLPESLSAQQVNAVAGYMQQLEGCMKTGENCPCSLPHGQPADHEDFRSSYRRYVDQIWQQGGRTVLTIVRGEQDKLGYRSEPVPLPPGFEVTPEDDGMLWQNIHALRKGQSLEVEISSTGPDSKRLRILSP